MEFEIKNVIWEKQNGIWKNKWNFDQKKGI